MWMDGFCTAMGVAVDDSRGVGLDEVFVFGWWIRNFAG